jgi:hypothetical protein
MPELTQHRLYLLMESKTVFAEFFGGFKIG